MDDQSPYRFREWLLEQLRVRQWTRSDLAARAEIDRSAVTKWLAPVDSPSFHRPNYESCCALARTLAVPLDTVLEEAGLKPPPTEATPLQRRVMTLIPRIPDPLLAVLYQQMVPMVDTRIQIQLVAALRRAEPLPRTLR